VRSGNTGKLAGSCWPLACGIAGSRSPVGTDGKLEGVRLGSGELVALDALFIHAGQEPRNQLAAQLGCRLSSAGRIEAGPRQEVDVAGLFIAGDLALDVQAVAVAVADGYRAAVAINRELREEDFP
jgi:thioredoxin reductase